MRAAYVPLVALLVAAPLVACSAHGPGVDDDKRPGIAATGGGGERHYAVTGVARVSLGASGDGEVRTGQAYGLTVTGAPGDLDTLKVTRDGSALGLGRKSGRWGSMGKVRWTVTRPRIAAADIGGSGSIAIDRVAGGRFDGNIGGSGDLSVKAMSVDKAAFAIGGSGTIDAAGTAGELSLSIGGSGKLRAAPLAAQTASVTIAGAGNVEATVRRHADVTIVGSGDVTIGGGAKCSVTKLGGGTVRCG